MNETQRINPRSADARLRVDLIVHELAPYRAHLVRRLAGEIPQVQFRVLLSTEFGGFRWDVTLPPEVECVLVGQGESILHKGRIQSWPREWAKGRRMIDLIRCRQSHAVVLFGYGDLGHLRLLRWCARRGIPTFLSADSNIRGDRARGIRAFAKQRLVRWIVKSCAGVLPWGRLGAEYFRKYGAPQERIFLVPHEPDYALIQNVQEETVQQVRVRHGLDPHRRRLIYSGRLAPEKRVDLLLNAFAALAAERPDWDLLIVGGGPLEAELRRTISAELAGRVTFTGAITDPGELAAVYRCGDILVLPSEYEPWGIVVNEALAAGMAVVCSDVVGAAADLLRDGVNGRVFRAGDLAALVDCIRDVTRLDLLPARQAAGHDILQAWRCDHDPVTGVRRTLSAAGVLPSA